MTHARHLAERLVYQFLAWFESFNSVWQTTILCVAVGVFEIGWPNVDKHLIAVLLVSLYATFTQNGLAHGGKRTAAKVDQALEQIDRVVDDLYVNTQTLLQLATSEASVQEALISQTAAITAALDEVKRGLKPRTR